MYVLTWHQVTRNSTHTGWNLHYVNAEANSGSDEHNVGIDRVRHVCDAFDGQVQQYASDHPDEKNGRESAQHFSPVPSERHRAGSRPGSHPQGAQRYHEAGKIRKEMRGVCRDRQTARQVTT